MELRFLERGTPLTINILNNDQTPLLSKPLRGTFEDAENNHMFTISCDDLHKRFDELNNCTLKITFSAKGAHSYNFTCKMIGIKINLLNMNLLELAPLSPINSVTIRTSPRIDIPLPVSIYKANAETTTIVDTEPLHSGLLFEGLSSDISTEGMGLLSNFKLTPEHGEAFIADIFFHPEHSIKIQVTLKRTNDSNDIFTFKYIHGFMFDFSNNFIGKNSLTMAIIQYLTDSN